MLAEGPLSGNAELQLGHLPAAAERHSHLTAVQRPPTAAVNSAPSPAFVTYYVTSLCALNTASAAPFTPGSTSGAVSRM